MAATTLVKDFLFTVCTTLQDVSPQFTRWPERELVTYTGFGQRAIAKYLPQSCSRVDAIQLPAGTKVDLTKVLAANIKPGDGTTGVDSYGIALLEVVRNMGSDGLTPGRIVRVVDRYTKDTNDPLWHTRVGTEVREFVFDKTLPRVLYVSPACQNKWVEVSWMVEPAALLAGSDDPNVPVYGSTPPGSTTKLGVADQYVDDLLNYVVGVALMKGSKLVQNLPKSQAHASLFTASINAQAQVFTGVNPNLKVLPFIEQMQAGA